ncbi:MAG: hypothetical protein JNN07_20660 [Verrucomicrobiales bacterium]|nr:hypothetical protein [Verrucomicrobiales bacterium]
MLIPPTWTLPQAIQLRLGQTTYGRQRAIPADGHVLLVLHKPPSPAERSREGVLFWRNERGEWMANRGGAGPGSLKRHVQAFAELEKKLSTDYESAKDVQALFDVLEAVTPLARTASNLHAALQTARESLNNDPFLIEMRDLAYEVDRNLDLLLQDVRNAIQCQTAREAEIESRLSQEALQESRRLNTLAALFFPLTALTSVFGMNLPSGIESMGVLLFWGIFFAGIVLGLAIKTWVTLNRPVSRSGPAKS